MGKVTATDYKQKTGLVRVKIADKKNDGDEYYLPWIRQRAGKDYVWWAPEVGEQVLIICPDSNLDRAIIVGALPYSGLEDSVTPPKKGKRWVLEEGEEEPSDDEKNKDETSGYYVHYEDDTSISYDKKLHIFQTTFLKDKTIDLKVDATKDKENANIKIKEDIDVKLNAEKDKEAISIKAKEVSVQIDAASGKEELSIDVNGETKLQMDGKGNITVNAKGSTVKMKNDGSVTLDCSKLTVKASGAIALNGSSIELNC